MTSPSFRWQFNNRKPLLIPQNWLVNGAHWLMIATGAYLKVLNISDSASTLQRDSNLDLGLDGAALLIPACYHNLKTLCASLPLINRKQIGAFASLSLSKCFCITPSYKPLSSLIWNLSIKLAFIFSEPKGAYFVDLLRELRQNALTEGECSRWRCFQKTLRLQEAIRKHFSSQVDCYGLCLETSLLHKLSKKICL